MNSIPTPQTQADIDSIRSEIDVVDGALLSLVARRVGFAEALAQAKMNGEIAFPLRPTRETEILRRLVRIAPPELDPDLIVEVWRALMGSVARKQIQMEIAVAGAGDFVRHWDAARKHFGAGAVLTRIEDPRAALSKAAEAGNMAVALPWPGNSGAGAWWPILNESRFSNLRILQAMPMRNDGKEPDALLVGPAIPMEAAGGDVTFALCQDMHFRSARALADAGMPGDEHARARALTLLRFDDFVTDQDPRVAALLRGGLDGLRVIGSFARV